MSTFSSMGQELYNLLFTRMITTRFFFFLRNFISITYNSYLIENIEKKVSYRVEITGILF